MRVRWCRSLSVCVHDDFSHRVCVRASSAHLLHIEQFHYVDVAFIHTQRWMSSRSKISIVFCCCCRLCATFVLRRSWMGWHLWLSAPLFMWRIHSHYISKWFSGAIQNERFLNDLRSKWTIKFYWKIFDRNLPKFKDEINYCLLMSRSGMQTFKGPKWAGKRLWTSFKSQRICFAVIGTIRCQQPYNGFEETIKKSWSTVHLTIFLRAYNASPCRLNA